MAASQARTHVAGKFSLRRGGPRIHRAHRRLGSANGAAAGASVSGHGIPRFSRRREFVRAPIPRALSGRQHRVGDQAGKDRSAIARAGDHRKRGYGEHRSHVQNPRAAPTNWNQHRHRRFRHGALVAELPETLSHRLPEDRPQLRRRSARSIRRRSDRAFSDRARARTQSPGRRRRSRDKAAARFLERARLPRSAGLLLRLPRARAAVPGNAEPDADQRAIALRPPAEGHMLTTEGTKGTERNTHVFVPSVPSVVKTHPRNRENTAAILRDISSSSNLRYFDAKFAATYAGSFVPLSTKAPYAPIIPSIVVTRIRTGVALSGSPR